MLCAFRLIRVVVAILSHRRAAAGSAATAAAAAAAAGSNDVVELREQRAGGIAGRASLGKHRVFEKEGRTIGRAGQVTRQRTFARENARIARLRERRLKKIVEMITFLRTAFGEKEKGILKNNRAIKANQRYWSECVTCRQTMSASSARMSWRITGARLTQARSCSRVDVEGSAASG